MSNHRIIYTHPDGRISVGDPNDQIIATMMGAGGMFREEEIDREVAKFLIASRVDEIAFHSDSGNFLAGRIGTRRELAIRRYITACHSGGQTEAAALDIVAAKDCPDGAAVHHIGTVADLPSDRYFRNAWEWSD